MKKHLLKIIKKYSKEYLISKPFPHVVIDNFLPFELAEKISKNITKEITKTLKIIVQFIPIINPGSI